MAPESASVAFPTPSAIASPPSPPPSPKSTSPTCTSSPSTHGPASLLPTDPATDDTGCKVACPRVHFRPRVRIGSGLRTRTRTHSLESLSSSSSTISAPLASRVRVYPGHLHMVVKAQPPPDERTPLVAEYDHEWRAQLIDEVFGTWPRRLLNHHWWWWQLEPIVCCLSAE
ncbi:hypothetical protein BJ138DRAFT_1149707 [Hygrophoropsis aurantiaca]|uniref:Uncharacterized protein n=1 Tax=Hygrophoropsis aurantiaca TaxID=72124 RepID=A0ACB8AFB1_9AGAM|nr:hypothetical protein BJ138DRAFT_1149707 [Hygrophoropsis aurantiaca]